MERGSCWRFFVEMVFCRHYDALRNFLMEWKVTSRKYKIMFGQKQPIISQRQLESKGGKYMGKGIKKGIESPLKAIGVSSSMSAQAAQTAYNNMVNHGAGQRGGSQAPQGVIRGGSTNTTFSAGAEGGIPGSGVVGKYSVKGNMESRSIRQKSSLKLGSENPRVFVRAARERDFGNGVRMQGEVELEYRNNKPNATIKGGMKIDFP